MSRKKGLMAWIQWKFYSVFHRLRMLGLTCRRNGNYRRYLRAQLRRTLWRRDMALARHRRLLIDRVAEAMEGQDTRDVLCVGCRNTVELDYFAEKGFSGVKGIDLFSQGRNIIVMDMHSMDFADNSFNVVYASHSLEHSYDIRKVVSEIVRVIRPGGIIAAEVPVHIAITDADRVDFGSVDGVVNAFGDSVDRVLWKETERGNSEQNEFRSDVARVVLRVRKS